MTVVSISKAAKLVGKSRVTLQRYIKQGKLSKVAGNATGIETSELIRVFGDLHLENDTDDTATLHAPMLQREAGGEVQHLHEKVALLQQQLALKDELLAEKDKRLLLLENKTKRKKFLGIF